MYSTHNKINQNPRSINKKVQMKRKIPPQNINQKRKKDDKKESEKKKRVVKRGRQDKAE